MTLVLDASVAVRVLSNRKADEPFRRYLASLSLVHAPQLLDAEVVSTIRGLTLGGQLTAERATEMVEDFSDLRIVRHPLAPLLHRVLALRHNVAAYDGCYVALAESLGLPLLTLDGRLARASGHEARIALYDADGW